MSAPHQGTATVTMLAVLLPEFQDWLTSRHLALTQAPGSPADMWIVVPDPAVFPEFGEPGTLD